MRSLPGGGTGLRVLAYSHDGMGLGHLRRNATIASELARTISGSTALLVASTPAHSLISLPAGVDLVKLPSILKVGTGEWRPRNLRVSTEEIRDLRAELIRTSATAFQPHFVLVDYLPTGVWGELVPTLEALRAQESPPHIVLGLRDILDSPTVTRALLKKERSYEALQEYFDAVWIYGRAGDFDTTAQYGLDSRVEIPVRHLGYLTAAPEPVPEHGLRSELGLPASKLIVLTAGGGYDAYPMMRASLEALRSISPSTAFHVVAVTGPLMPEVDRENLERLARGMPARVIESTSAMGAYLQTADLIVTMGGYNTVMESLRRGKSTIVIPREGPSAEQVMRAGLFQDLGAIRSERLTEGYPERLKQAITDGLEGRLGSMRKLPFDGLEEAVSYVKRHCIAAAAEGAVK